MMRIAQYEGGWTVLDGSGKVMLRCVTAPGKTDPLVFATRREVSEVCHRHGLYEVKADNPSNFPEGTLVELVIGDKPCAD